MIALYSGIYRVALDLHRRSEEKRRKQETSLATMAKQTVSHLGTAVIGMTRSAQLDAQIMQQQQVPGVRSTITHQVCVTKILKDIISLALAQRKAAVKQPALLIYVKL